jgi:FkbH-like protein
MLALAKAGIAAGNHAEAFSQLCAGVTPDSDFVTQSRAARLFASIPAGTLPLKPLRLALVASTTVDHFADLLRFWLAAQGFEAALWIAPYDTMVATVMDAGSELYLFKPDLVWLFTTHRDVRFEVALGDNAGAEAAVDGAIGQTATLWQTLADRLGCPILQNNADIPAVDSLGNFAGQVSWSQRNCLRLYNLRLASHCPPGVSIFDLEHLAASFGLARWEDARYWYHSKNAFSFDAAGRVAAQAARVIAALKGQARKCLVLDLDNTLWGGVIGDDGMAGIKLGNGADGEAFRDFQAYVRKLKDRGVILAVCSKNDEENAREPFARHPDMVLRAEDIAVFRANWDNKADNIRAIAATLNIGLDSLVFADDNPVERNLVRQYLPMVAVPELPDDPSGYIAAIAAHGYFETTAFSGEDAERARYYRDNAQRSELQHKFTDTADYLRSLEMTSELGPLDAFHLPRMSQLIGKSNQFHLTGTRYSEAELQALAARDGVRIRYYKLKDRFGDNGLISVVVLVGQPGGDLVVDTWVMSCRVLSRTMEEFICNDIMAVAAGLGSRHLVGRYVPSAKNKLVSGLYQRLGWSLRSEEDGTTVWQLDLAAARPRTTHISAEKPSVTTKGEYASAE